MSDTPSRKLTRLDAEKRPPPIIPDHELLRLVGEGSYGEVWLARSVTGQYRAVKVVHRSKFTESRPFDREFKGMLKYEPISRAHPGLVTILHVGINQEGGYFYYIMELADDCLHAQKIEPQQYMQRTLSTELHSRGRLPFEECIQITRMLTSALQHLHEQKLVHRDIKPSNIIFVNGVAKLADVGLVANIDSSMSAVGTPGYIPREGPGNPQADLYGLGKVLYEMSTGKDRLEYPELPTDLEHDLNRESILRLNRVVLNACAEPAENRYASATEMLADIEKARGGKAVATRRSRRRLVAMLSKTTIILASLAIAGSVGWWLRPKTQPTASPPGAAALQTPVTPAPPVIAGPTPHAGLDLTAAKRASLQAQSCVNLRQIFMGMALYAADNHGRYPTSLTPLMQYKYLNPINLLSPLDNISVPESFYAWSLSEQSAWARARCSYVFLRLGQRETLDFNTVFGFEKPGPGKNGMAILFDDGRTLWMSESGAGAVIQKQTGKSVDQQLADNKRGSP